MGMTTLCQEVFRSKAPNRPRRRPRPRSRKSAVMWLRQFGQVCGLVFDPLFDFLKLVLGKGLSNWSWANRTEAIRGHFGSYKPFPRYRPFEDDDDDCEYAATASSPHELQTRSPPTQTP